jgi:dihydrofolate reductase
MGAFYRSIDAAVIGRKTYDFAVRYGMTDPNPGKKNYVLSRTLTKTASPEVIVVNEPIAEFAQRLRAEKCKDV